MDRIYQDQIVSDFKSLGVKSGDSLLIRADLGTVGRIQGGASTFIDALLEVVGPEGSIMSLAFTKGSFFWRPSLREAYSLDKKSYAGALPNTMILRKDSIRSAHPTCSYIAIGRKAKSFLENHDAESGAYEPVRKLIQAGGKCVLVGCVGSSPGFTTTHLAEVDLGLHHRVIFPWMYSAYYRDDSGALCLFRRRDPGLCSNSFYKFYAHYMKESILSVGHVGLAYSILAEAKKAYDIDYKVLSQNPRFNVCDSPECINCNARRWDRLHRIPDVVVRLIWKMLKRRVDNNTDSRN